MELLKELNKSPLVTLSQKGPENTITSMWTWQKHNQITDGEKLEHANLLTSRHVHELDALTTEHGMKN